MKTPFVYQLSFLVLLGVSSIGCSPVAFQSVDKSSDHQKVTAEDLDIDGNIISVVEEGEEPNLSTTINPIGPKEEIMDFNAPENEPTVCAPGSICFAGRKLNFRNDAGKDVIVEVVSTSTKGFSARFTSPAQREIFLNFAVVGKQLVTSQKKGWKPQFCYKHEQDPCIVMPTPVGNDQYNCHSALNWYGDFNGDTHPLRVICPGQY